MVSLQNHRLQGPTYQPSQVSIRETDEHLPETLPVISLLEHRHPELLLQLERRHGFLRSGPLFLPVGVRLQRSESGEPQTEPADGLHYSGVSPTKLELKKLWCPYMVLKHHWVG